MPAGRKPLPSKLKVLRGTDQPCRMNLNEAEPEVSIPSPPRHLSREAKKEWERISQELFNLGLMSSIDRAALSAYCQAYGRWVDAEKQIYADPENPKFTTFTSKGLEMAHPLVSVANASLALMHKFLTEFGMSPSSRSKVQANKPKKNEKKGFAALG